MKLSICTACHGAGVETCSYCAGSGHEGSSRCPACHGDKKETCHVCWGTGDEEAHHDHEHEKLRPYEDEDPYRFEKEEYSY